MKKSLLAAVLLTCFSFVKAQSLQFKFADSTFLPMKPAGQLHGISAIEYEPSKKQWHLAGDRGAYFVFSNINTIRDFEPQEKTLIAKSTHNWFEAVRFDKTNGRFLYAVENEYEPVWENIDTTTFVAYYDGYPPKSERPKFLIPPMWLPADNKGIEGMAVSDSGVVWVAPEAGWAGETEVGQDTIHFWKFEKNDIGYVSPQSFSYVIDRSGCPYSKTEHRGGISEILSVNEKQLLVLERCYDNGKGGSEIVKAKLWQVTVEGNHLKKDPEPAFDFNKGLPFIPDNLEGMSWWPTESGKRKLVVVSDDNPGLKNKQRTQLILLEEK
ncbi:esterase-like activity of phytase family protein [Dyadobacter sp. CY312]|uniref:esterase-like activity of phytase family protein n=1 Tax=Dyadobacter sp. CY312 TaxID=2907303 RepID=UPI001F25ADCE|nr:esterase-like activity of phytase family protein [Dyadobacter sp. CY312]MCE7039579.1 esterase-like activity of phytase family protein [Dyadobacter sp. CY312]